MIALALALAAAAPVLHIDAARPPWSGIVNEARSPDRVRRALTLFDGASLPAALANDAHVLAWAAGTARDDTESEGLVTPVQGLHALTTLANAPQALRAVTEDLLTSAESDGERATILKEIGAHASVDDVRELASRVRGRDLAWLVANTTPYGTNTASGIKQTYKDSCMPAIDLVARAEIDPLLALRLKDNSAPREKLELETEGGVAALRGSSARGRGTRDHSLLLALGSDLGADTEVLPRSHIGATEIDRMEQILADGIDVPLRIATVNDAVAHSVIAVDVKRADGKRWFRIHDPWTGSSSWVLDDDVRAGWLVPTESGEQRHVTHAYLYVPHQATTALSVR